MRKMLRETALPAIRTAMPLSLATRVVDIRVRRHLGDAARMRDARDQMAFVLPMEASRGEIEAAARAYIRSQVERFELRWQPETVWDLGVEGVQHLQPALRTGRGVILNFMHYGRYDGAFTALSRADVPLNVVIRHDILAESASAVAKQHARLVGEGTQLVSTATGFDGMARILQEGKILAIASDVPGSTRLRFCGNEVFGRSGAAHLARQTGSAIAMMTIRRELEGRGIVEVSELLEPDDFDTPTELLQHMLNFHENAIRRYPGWSNLPIRRWNLNPPGRNHA